MSSDKQVLAHLVLTIWYVFLEFVIVLGKTMKEQTVHMISIVDFLHKFIHMSRCFIKVRW